MRALSYKLFILPIEDEGKRNAKTDFVIIKLTRTQFRGRIQGIEKSSKFQNE